ncbi:MAG: zinc ribbon domain-containing protein [Thermomicrobiales bacterium]
MIETAARGAQFLLAIGIAYLIAVWFALVAWTFRDIESRSRSVFTQVFSTLLVVLFFAPGLILYLILRPKESLDQAFQRALEEEYLLQDLDDLPLCLGCQRAVEADFVLCPHCQTRLRGPCPACSRLIDLRWGVCPYCAVPVDRAALDAPSTGSETIRILEDGRSGRRKRAMAAAALRVGIDPDELDALSDALSGTANPAAVGAGSTSSGLSSRIASIGEFSRIRDGVRARLGNPVPDTGTSSQSEGTMSPLDETAPNLPGEDDGFWADPLPGVQTRRDRSP